MDRESVNVIEPFDRIFFSSFIFFPHHNLHTRARAHTDKLRRRYRIAHEYKSEQKQYKKKHSIEMKLTRMPFVYLSLTDMLMFHLSARKKTRSFFLYREMSMLKMRSRRMNEKKQSS